MTEPAREPVDRHAAPGAGQPETEVAASAPTIEANGRLRGPQSSRVRFDEYVERLQRERRDATRSETRGAGQSSGASHEVQRPRPRTRTAWQLIFEFWKLLGDARAGVVYALVTVTVSTLLGLVPPAATKLIIDEVLTPSSAAVMGQPAGELPAGDVRAGGGPSTAGRWLPSDWDPATLLTTVLVVLIGVGLTRSVVALSGRWVATRATKRLQMSLRKRVFAHASRLPMMRVIELKSGGASSLLREDAGSVGELIFGLLYNPWRAVVQLAGSLFVLALVDWRLLLGGTVLLPVVYITHNAWISRIRPQYRAVRKTRLSMDAQTTEVFGGMRVVRAFGRQRTEATRFLRSNNLLSRQELRAWWWSRGIELLWDALIPMGSALLLWYGGLRVLSGALTLGELMMFLAYLLMLLEPLAVLAESATSLQNSLAGLDRVLDLLAEPTEQQLVQPPASASASASAVAGAGPTAPRRISRAEVRGQLRLEQVTFRYPGTTRDVLRHVSLDIPAGQTIALVGPSGAGKTTLSNLAARYFEPTEGRVLLDGHDVRHIDLESYRRLLGIVEQDVFLFDGSIAENIAYGRHEATYADVRAAAEIAQADEFIREFAQGYDTIIGERGVKLSGGQRQRLAIARALLADPKLLILDEATSNLDTASEQRIQEGLERLMRGRTCLVIAHRLSTIRRADQIVVLEQGRIVEQGTHDELLARASRYRDMLALQQTLAEE